MASVIGHQEEIFTSEGGEAVARVAQGGCGCPIIRAQSQLEWGPEHPGLVEGVPTPASLTSPTLSSAALEFISQRKFIGVAKGKRQRHRKIPRCRLHLRHRLHDPFSIRDPGAPSTGAAGPAAEEGAAGTRGPCPGRGGPARDTLGMRRRPPGTFQESVYQPWQWKLTTSHTPLRVRCSPIYPRRLRESYQEIFEIVMKAAEGASCLALDVPALLMPCN
ncbi:uncharacterized protein LOC120754226 [Hirundo rustica]|uniref:uncharacterized protein LOC120754226 n=1 Tax=Hirundo rustica TaxID=43150 RepID=UPI001A948D37|nr:uncharacterized protein LOC120754226 [Hirundo rustica]